MIETQTLFIICNVIFLCVVVAGSTLLIHKLKLGSKNHILLFVLFTVFWMAPLMCREYTGQMHIAMNNVRNWPQDGGTLLWVPLTIYGIVGLIYRPLTDVLSYKMKSRKNILYISLAIQFATLIPFFFSQTLATNIIQSVGTGIGASIIGVFNLMFSEEHHSKRIFKTVSIMAIPPLLAELITGGIKSIICSFLPEQIEVYGPNAMSYLNLIKYMWLVAIMCVGISLVLTIIFKEDKKLIFHDLKFKEPVKTKADWSVVILIAAVAICLGFLRWTCSGPLSVTQFVYLGEIATVNDVPVPFSVTTKYMEGYLSVICALGQIAGVVITSAALQKKQRNAKWVLVLSGGLIFVLYLCLNTVESNKFLNAYVYFGTNFISGLAYGLIFPVIIGIMLNKHFDKVKIITPVGIFNTCLAGGITAASIVNSLAKGGPFDMTPSSSGWRFDDFVHANHSVNRIAAFLAISMIILFVISYIIHTKYPPKMTKIGVKYRSGYVMEI